MKLLSSYRVVLSISSKHQMWKRGCLRVFSCLENWGSCLWMWTRNLLSKVWSPQRTSLTADLNSRLANAFAVGMRVLSCSESRHQDLLLRSLEQIFCIMCYQPFESPLVLAAAYIALLRVGSTDVPTCGGSFARIISKLDLNDLDLLLQEIVATAIDEPAAVVVLEVTIRAAVMRLEDEGAKKSEIHFSLGKVLFNITRNILVTRSSDIFVSFLRLAGKFLREIVASLVRRH